MLAKKFAACLISGVGILYKLPSVKAAAVTVVAREKSLVASLTAAAGSSDSILFFYFLSFPSDLYMYPSPVESAAAVMFIFYSCYGDDPIVYSYTDESVGRLANTLRLLLAGLSG